MVGIDCIFFKTYKRITPQLNQISSKKCPALQKVILSFRYKNLCFIKICNILRRNRMQRYFSLIKIRNDRTIDLAFIIAIGRFLQSYPVNPAPFPHKLSEQNIIFGNTYTLGNRCNWRHFMFWIFGERCFEYAILCEKSHRRQGEQDATTGNLL